MSPRSEELRDAARRRLSAAAEAVDEDPATAISAAYYAMLYAARAALSERDIYAKTHTGTWHEFRNAFVADGKFEAHLLAAAQQVQREREEADYEAWAAPKVEADRVIELARTFLSAVEPLLEG